MSELLESLIAENKKLRHTISVISEKLSIAIEGLKALASDGNILSIPQKTLDEIESCSIDLPQDKDNNIKN